MTLRTFTGNTLKEALEAARRALGEDFYLVDSISPKTPGEPARVIVMIRPGHEIRDRAQKRTSVACSIRGSPA
jgi:flagellar biosynthesis GTPase FlhF